MLVHTRLVACCLKLVQGQAKLVVREIVLELSEFLIVGNVRSRLPH